MFTPKEILKGALTLKPAEKAKLVNKLLSSLDKPDRDIDQLWAKEAESRIVLVKFFLVKVKLYRGLLYSLLNSEDDNEGWEGILKVKF